MVFNQSSPNSCFGPGQEWSSGRVGHSADVWWLEEIFGGLKALDRQLNSLLNNQCSGRAVESCMPKCVSFPGNYHIHGHLQVCTYHTVNKKHNHRFFEFVTCSSFVSLFIHSLGRLVASFKKKFQVCVAVVLWHRWSIQQPQLNTPFIGNCLTSIWQVLWWRRKVSFPCLKHQQPPLMSTIKQLINIW